MCLGDGSICGSFDKSEELIFRSEEFSIHFLHECEMSDELFGESGNGIGEVSNRRKNVDGLVGTTDRVSARTRAAHVRGASRRVRTSLANRLGPTVRRTLCRGRLGRLHRGRRERGEGIEAVRSICSRKRWRDEAAGSHERLKRGSMNLRGSKASNS